MLVVNISVIDFHILNTTNHHFEYFDHRITNSTSPSAPMNVAR